MPEHEPATMPNLQQTKGSRRVAVALRWLERGLLVIGAMALIWCGLLVADQVIAQRNARDALRKAAEERLPAPALEDVTETAPRSPVDIGAAIATLSIPRIGLSAAVLHGSDAKTLRRAPGHLEHTAYPGETGNAVIAGHRDTFFRPLRNVRVGDDIFLDASSRRFHYRVTSLQVVNPREVSVLAPTDEATLTLITCYPFWVLGHAPDRFIVRAIRVDPPAAPLEARIEMPPELDGPPISASDSVSASVVAMTANDDESSVQRVLERYRRIYNARLASEATTSSDRPLTFRPCQIVVNDDRATAECEDADQASSELARGRTFILDRVDDTWAIRSITVN